MSSQKRVEEIEGPCRSLCLLVRVAFAFPALTVALCLLGAAVGALYSLRALTFMTSGRDLLPPGQAYVQRDQEISRNFAQRDEVVVVVEAQNPDQAKAYASRLAGELERHPNLYEHITYRIDRKAFEGHELLYLSIDQLSEIRDEIFDHRDFIDSFAPHPTLAQLIDSIRTQLVRGLLSSYFNLELTDDENPVDLGFVKSVLGGISARLDDSKAYRSPWSSLFSQGPENGDSSYFLSDDGRLLFILVGAIDEKGSFTGEREAIETLRVTITSLAREFPYVNVGVTGAPALSNDEMVTAFGDSERAATLAGVLTFGVLILAFRRIAMPVAMLLTLAVSLCWSLAVITLFVGHLSIFSIMFISIVIGIGIDYGIYFLFRTDEELLVGRDQREALERTAARSGPGMLIGSLTAAGTFFVLMATEFRGIQELGLIAGIAILLAWLSMMTMFPALITLTNRQRRMRLKDSGTPALQLEQIRAPLIERVTRYPKTIMTGAAVVTLLSVLALPGVGFDYNLLHLQPASTESVIWEQRILATAGRSSFAALTIAETLDELRRKATAFHQLGSVSEVNSVLQLLPAEQEAKREILSQFAPLVEAVRIGQPTPVDLDRLIVSLRTLRRRLDLAVAEAGPRPERDEIAATRDQAAALIRELEQSERIRAQPALDQLQDEIHRDFARALHDLRRNTRAGPVGPDDLPGVLRRKFIGRDGRFLLEIHPKVDIWNRSGAERFVTELRSVDPLVAGIPIVTFEAIRHMERAYKEGTVYAFIVVALLSALLIRHLRETVLAILSLTLGTVWTIGLMRAFGLPFNLGNVFGLPLIIGVGAEFGLNIVLRYLEGREHGGPLVARSTTMAVLVNGLTTIVGFGSLMIADHRGIFGLGLLLTLGMIATLTASLIVLPVALLWSRPLSGRHLTLLRAPPQFGG